MIITHCEQETLALGRRLANLLQSGDVLFLVGELGAGKSVLARGIAQGLGITEPVSSPTFTLLNCYEGRLPLHHFDLYRLEGDDDFYAAGLEDYVGGAAVALIEWPSQCPESLPENHLLISIEYGAQENERIIRLTGEGGFREMTIE